MFQFMCDFNSAVIFSYTTDAYVCRLNRRWDPETATHRWSMPWDERCLCQGVVAPKEGSNPPRDCPLVRGDVNGTNGYWFTDNKKDLTRRRNWTPSKLNDLLERAVYCGGEYDLGRVYIILHGFRLVLRNEICKKQTT